LNLRAVFFGLLALPVLAQPPAGGQNQPPAREQPMSTLDVLNVAERAIQAARQLADRGRTAEATMALTEAQRALESVLAVDPRNVEARVLAGELALAARDADAARRAFRSVLDDDPLNFRANLGLGQLYVTSHYWRQAMTYLEAARNVAPPDRRAEVLQLLAQAYNGAGYRREAVDAAEQAVAADPDRVPSIQLLVQLYLEAGQFDKALDRARRLSAAARKAREANPSDRTALQTLLTACQTQMQALSGYYRSLCQRDARGQYTDQIQPGREAEAVDVLSEVAHLNTESAWLSLEMSHHQALALLEPVRELQSEAVRRAFDNSTRYLLDLATLLRATHQEERAIQTLRRLLEIENPSDSDPAAARRNRELAEELLRQMGAAPATQPAAPR